MTDVAYLANTLLKSNHAERWVRTIPDFVKLFDFNFGASVFQLFLQRFGIGLGHAFLHSLGCAVYEVLGFASRVIAATTATRGASAPTTGGESGGDKRYENSGHYLSRKSHFYSVRG